MILSSQKPGLSRSNLLLLGLLGLLLIAAPAILGLLQTYQVYIRYGPATVLPTYHPWIVSSLTSLACLLAIGFYKHIQSKGAIFIYKDVIVIKPPLRKSLHLTWEQITGIAFSQESLGIRTKNFPELKLKATLYTRKGQRILLNNFCAHQDMIKIVTYIKAKLYPRLEPELRKHLLAGQEITFGPLRLTHRGIALRRIQYPWAEIKRVTIHQGCLLIYLRQGNPLLLPVAKIPNIELLLSLIKIAAS